MKILSRPSHNISRKQIDEDALKVLNRLNRNGFRAYLVGGAVRDMLLGRTPKDYDIATDARPGQIKKLFANCFLIGRRFRLAHIRFRGSKIIEVATFRREPEEGSDDDIHNTFGTPEEDSYRRDITINALFYSISDFSIIDYVGGLDDLKSGIIRIIGDPDKRFKEDPVRILRVLRHSARLGFKIHNETAKMIFEDRHLLKGCSGSRMYEEFCRDMVSGSLEKVVSLMDLFGILPDMIGKAGTFYSDRPESLKNMLKNLERIDSLAKSDQAVSPQDVLTIMFKEWADRLLDDFEDCPDRSKYLHDAIIGSGLGIQIPKVIVANMAQILTIMNNMKAFVSGKTGRFNDKKKAHYADASKIFGIINNIEPGITDPFTAEYLSRLQTVPARKRVKKRYYRKPAA
jgi:poly(A) polymerase